MKRLPQPEEHEKGRDRDCGTSTDRDKIGVNRHGQAKNRELREWEEILAGGLDTKRQDAQGRTRQGKARQGKLKARQGKAKQRKREKVFSVFHVFCLGLIFFLGSVSCLVLSRRALPLLSLSRV
jgi:hypothetical protein